MYEIAEVLQRIDDNFVWVLVFTLIAWITGFVQIIEAMRLGARDRVPGMPAGMTVFLLAHDSSFFMRCEHWFGVVDHWYFKLFWVGMGFAVLIELYLVAQFLRYGRPLLAPRASSRTFFANWLCFQFAAFALLWWLQSLIDDPLYLVSLVGTQVAAVIFNVPMLLARGDARGQSRIYAWATILGPGGFALGLFPALSPVFFNGYYAAVVIAMVALSLVYLLMLEQALRATPRR